MTQATTTAAPAVETAPVFDTKPSYSDKRTKCPVTRQEFLQHATPLPVSLNGTPMGAEVKEFSTGSLGWYSSGKITVLLDGKPVTVQVGLTMTVVGSKDLPQ